MGKSQRTKGHNFERWVARELRAIYGADVCRGLQSFSGKAAPDVNGVPDMWIECKVGARPNIRAALLQAEQATDGRTPVAICKFDRDPSGPIVSMRWDAWADMLFKLEHDHGL